MGNEKSLRKGDGFLDDFINLFFLRPAFRDDATQSSPGQKPSEENRPDSSSNRDLSMQGDNPNRDLNPLGKIRHPTKLPKDFGLNDNRILNKLIEDYVNEFGERIRFSRSTNRSPKPKHSSTYEVIIKKPVPKRVSKKHKLLLSNARKQAIWGAMKVDETENQPPSLPLDQTLNSKTGDE